MQQRKFITLPTVVIVGFYLLTFLLFHACQKSNINENNTNFPNLVIVKGGSITDRYRLGIKALGSLNRININGQKVLVKPTLKWNMPPDSGLSTQAELLSAIIQDCYKEKAGGVYLTSNTVDDWRACYKNSGIEETAKKALARIIPSGIIDYYKKPKDGKLHFHKLTEKCDLIVNVAAPIPGNLFEAGIASLGGLTYENNFSENINENYLSELLKTCKPALTIIDSPTINTLIISADPVLADAMACSILGIDPTSVPYLKTTEELGFGSVNVDKADIQVIELE